MTVTNVTLRNGKEVPEPMIATTMLALCTLAESDFIAFYELVAVCRDKEHVIFGDCAAKIAGFGLMESAGGEVHDAIRDVVLAAVTGEDFGLSLQSPLPES